MRVLDPREGNAEQDDVQVTVLSRVTEAQGDAATEGEGRIEEEKMIREREKWQVDEWEEGKEAAGGGGGSAGAGRGVA